MTRPRRRRPAGDRGRRAAARRARRARRRQRGRAESRGGQAIPRLPDGGAGRRAARRRGAVRGGRRRPRPADRRAGVDRRPARRHPRVLRTGSRRLGSARRAVAVGRTRRRRGRPSGAGHHARHPRRQRTAAGTARQPRIVVSRTRPPAVALAVRDALDGALVEMGSAGAKVASVVQGLSDVYVHAGGQYEWDSAAPVAVARAAGLHTSRIDGSPLVYNQPDPLLPDLVVCRPEFADAVLAVTRGGLAPCACRPRRNTLSRDGRDGDLEKGLVKTEDMAKARASHRSSSSISCPTCATRFVRSHRGRDGGYELARRPQISLADVLRCIDGPLASVHDTGSATCPTRGRRLAHRRLARAARQHARRARSDQPRRRRRRSLPKHVGELADDYRSQGAPARGHSFH